MSSRQLVAGHPAHLLTAAWNVGTAHGATSHFFASLEAAFGVLAKNTCAAAANFLIDRVETSRQRPASGSVPQLDLRRATFAEQRDTITL